MREVNRCHQCTHYPASAPPSSYCGIAGKNVFASTHACPDGQARGVEKHTPETRETTMSKRECVRKGCHEPVLEGKKICEEHYRVVMEGQAKRVDIPQEPELDCDRPCSEDPCDHETCARDADEAVQNERPATYGAEAPKGCSELAECLRDLSSTPCGADPCELAIAGARLREAARTDTGTKSSATVTVNVAGLPAIRMRDELIGTLARLAIAQIQAPDLYDDTETVDVLDRIKELVA